METALVIVIVTVSFVFVAVRVGDWAGQVFGRQKKPSGCAGCGTHSCGVKLKRAPQHPRP